MTKIIFSRDAYVASRTRAYMSYDKMSYASARRRAVHDFNHSDWTKLCDGEEVIVDEYGYRIYTFDGIGLRCGAYMINKSWCIEVEDDD